MLNDDDDDDAGGVTSMPDFLKKFFPVVYRKTQDPNIESNYCKYDNQGLQLFTSSLYLAGLTATFFASYTTRRFGRRPTMLIAGFFFIIGVVLNAAAQDLAMLIIGRILLGCGVGFANQVFFFIFFLIHNYKYFYAYIVQWSKNLGHTAS